MSELPEDDVLNVFAHEAFFQSRADFIAAFPHNAAEAAHELGMCGGVIASMVRQTAERLGVESGDVWTWLLTAEISSDPGAADILRELINRAQE